MIDEEDKEYNKRRQYAHDLFWEGNKRLLTPEEFATVIREGYMIGHDDSYNDDDRWNEWHTFLALQQIFQLRAIKSS